MAAERPAKRARSSGRGGSMEDAEDTQLQAALVASLREAAPAGGSRGGGGGSSSSSGGGGGGGSGGGGYHGGGGGGFDVIDLT